MKSLSLPGVAIDELRSLVVLLELPASRCPPYEEHCVEATAPPEPHSNLLYLLIQLSGWSQD